MMGLKNRTAMVVAEEGYFSRRRANLVLLLGAALAAISLALAMMVDAKPAQAAFPGDNGKIVFLSNRTTGTGVDNPTGDYEIFMMNDNGTGLTQLTNNTALDNYPAFSPDGTKIAFSSNRDGDMDVYKMNAAPESATNQPRNLTNSTGSADYDAAWSPNGKKIAFVSYLSGNQDIYKMSSDGSGKVRLTKSSEDDIQPAWSPGGRKIAFFSDRSGDGEIYVMKASRPEGKRNHPRNLSKHPGYDLNPNWSPDGTQIAFHGVGEAAHDIFTMAPDGTDQTPLTDNPTQDEDAAWSPDGTRIAFMSGLYSHGEIYVMNSDGSNQVNITNNPGDDVSPDWQPIP